MSRITRRDFLKLTGGASAASALGMLGLSEAAHAAKHGNMGAHVVVVGGGFGGATCAKYLRRAGINVTLVEPSTRSSSPARSAITLSAGCKRSTPSRTPTTR